MKKALIILSTFFLFQTLYSCWVFGGACECENAEAFENTYTNIEIEAYDLSGFNSKPLEAKAYKNAFGLMIGAKYESKEINTNKGDNLKLGFNSAMATQDCNCLGDNYRYTDQLLGLNVFVVDAKTQKTKEVSDLFLIESYNGKQISIEEFFKSREKWDNNFRIKLSKFESIPDKCIFICEIKLESGKILSSETKNIEFY